MSDSEDDSSTFDEDSSSDSSVEEEENALDSGKKEEEEEEEGDDEDPVVKAIKQAQLKKQSNRPPDIKLSDVPCNICFHPSEDIIAVSNYNGGLDL